MFKKIIPVVLITLLSGLITDAIAVNPGFYMGLMTGPASNSGKTTNAVLAPGNQQPLAFTPVSPKSQLWGTAVYMGYKNNQYIGSELGVNFYTNVKFESKTNQPTAAGTSAHARNVYIVLKGTVPFGSAFDAFLKVGPAFQYISTGAGLNAPNTQCRKQPGPQPPQAGPPCIPVTRFQTKYKSKVSPIISIGASWAMSQNWVADVSLTTLPVSGVIKNITWFAVGISYHFVDTFCGQFICG
jgi:opacity protein-like surface antigen